MKNPHLEELGQFLKARRGDLNPAELGLPIDDATARRVSGLRREEIATRASISTDYYARVEQGRLAPTRPVLDAISHALGLTPVQRTYAERLARQAAQEPTTRRQPPAARPQVQRLLDRLTLTPAFVIGKYLDYLAWNPLAGTLLLDLDDMPPHERNYVRMLFTDPRMQHYYDDWETQARNGLALLRMQTIENPNEPRLARLVGELSITSPTFRQWWAGRHVASQDFGAKTIHHPDHGTFTFDWDSYYWTGDTNQHITVWSPEPGSRTEQKIRDLSAALDQA